MAQQPTTTTKKDWSNDPPPAIGQQIENDIAKPTPREVEISALAEKAKDLKAKNYTVTSKSKTHIRVIHDAENNRIAFKPEETKRNVMLFPHMAEYLGKTDLTVEAA